jgi:DNA-binding transcriptional ArsR family regulator
MKTANTDIVEEDGTHRVFDVDEQRLFEALADPKARELLVAASRPLTASELGDRCSLPTSTLYRKLDTLEAAGLLRVTSRRRTGGNHAKTYERRVETVEVSLGDAPRPAVLLTV